MTAARARHTHVVLDGTPIPAGRVAADRPSYSRKHNKHGMNLQLIARGRPRRSWGDGRRSSVNIAATASGFLLIAPACT
jgi:hypothetical protein